MTLPDPDNILLFLTAATILIITPGPAVIYITAKSIDQGVKAGLVSVLGISAGGLVHVLGAGIGISAVIVASSTVFMFIKYLGAVYLVYLGLRKIFGSSPKDITAASGKKQKLTDIFYEGFIVNALNPKTAIFFLAFLPQFVSINKGGITTQIIFMGMLFVIIAFFSDAVYALISGKISHWLKTNKTYLTVQRYLIGSIYILLGLMTLAVNQPGENSIDTK